MVAELVREDGSQPAVPRTAVLRSVLGSAYEMIHAQSSPYLPLHLDLEQLHLRPQPASARLPLSLATPTGLASTAFAAPAIPPAIAVCPIVNVGPYGLTIRLDWPYAVKRTALTAAMPMSGEAADDKISGGPGLP